MRAFEHPLPADVLTLLDDLAEFCKTVGADTTSQAAVLADLRGRILDAQIESSVAERHDILAKP